MNFLLEYANFILVGIGVWFAQDSIASIWYYWGKETWGNHAFRIARLVMAVFLIIIGVNI